MLTAEQVEKLAEQLSAANEGIVSIAKKVDAKTAEIQKLTQQAESLKAAGDLTDGKLKEINAKIDALASSCQALAAQYTNLVELSRQSSIELARVDTVGERIFRPRLDHQGIQREGSLFACRQQAVELGYFFMATMAAATPAKQYALRWLKEHTKDLQFLPTALSKGDLVNQIGASYNEVMQRCHRRGFEFGAESLVTNLVPGSTLVTPEFANTFIRNVELYGAFRQNATLWPMGSDQTQIPRRKSGVSIYWPGEAGAGTTSDPSFELLTLLAKKAMGMHQYSSELAQDENAAIALADLVMYEFALAYAKEEDRIGFNGDGTGGASPGFAGFYGVFGLSRQAYAAEGSEDLNKVLKYDASTGLDRTDEVTLKGLRTVIGLCHTWASLGAKWYAHRTVLQDLYGIETTGGGPITSSDSSGRTQLLGYPVVPVEVATASPGAASTGCFAFGDLRKGWMLGDRRALEMQTSDHYAFNTDMLTLRFTQRFGILPVMPTAMVVYVTGAAA